MLERACPALLLVFLPNFPRSPPAASPLSRLFGSDADADATPVAQDGWLKKLMPRLFPALQVHTPGAQPWASSSAMKAIKGTILTCDPAAKQLILAIDERLRLHFVIQDLDETHLVVSPDMVGVMRVELEAEVRAAAETLIAR